MGLCTQELLGTFIHADNATRVRTEAVHVRDLGEDGVIHYDISRTGYYCVGAVPMSSDFNFEAVVEFRNAFGELPGGQVPKLAFYGGLGIGYALIGILWGFLYYQHRSDILPVQNYITATLIFLVVEMLLTWGYYDYQNRHGKNVGAMVLMIFVSILNAARLSFSFFLLLIVCMGYGVVKPSLGKTMVWVRWLAVAHFTFGVIYAIGSLTVKPEDAGPLVLLVVFPLAATGTAFYVWTLNALGATMKDLYDRKQRTKALMYRKLWWCILLTIVVIFGFFVLNILFFSGTGSPDFTPVHWRSRWFILDGWLGLVYLADVMFICYVWRPTANNRRFAMSEELAQDDDGGFEIASIGGRDSLDDLVDDEEATREAAEDGGWGKSGPPLTRAENGNASDPRATSPLPAPKPQRPPGQPSNSHAQSLDEGETLFAVGEDGDRFSDDGEGDEEGSDAHDDSERKRLTGKKD